MIKYKAQIKSLLIVIVWFAIMFFIATKSIGQTIGNRRL